MRAPRAASRCSTCPAYDVNLTWLLPPVMYESSCSVLVAHYYTTRTQALTHRRIAGRGVDGDALGGERPAPEDEVGGLLGDHDGRPVEVAADDARHDRGVDNAQPLDAAQAQRAVDDRRLVGAHLAGAARVIGAVGL